MKTFHLFILALFTGTSLAIAEKSDAATPRNMLLIITDQQTVGALSALENHNERSLMLGRSRL